MITVYGIAQTVQENAFSLIINGFSLQILRSNVDESDVHEVAKKLRLNTFEEFYKELMKEDEDSVDTSMLS